MVKPTLKFQYLADQSVDISFWLGQIQKDFQLKDITRLQQACEIVKKSTQGLTTFYGKSFLEHGLEVAEIILKLKLDQETAIAGLISSSLPHLQNEIIVKEFGNDVAKLIIGIHQIDVISIIQKQQQNRNQLQIDKLRKMLLAMATDIRVVIIKLAERLSFMRGIKAIPAGERKQFAQEVIDIYAPLANRLGIGQLKWELEDLAFHYLNPETYKKIAGLLAERRAERENRVNRIITELQEKLKNSEIKAEISGRAKHIYSIYSKLRRKDVEYDAIYDYIAVRILVPTIEDCYTALSIVNSLWPPIMEEFDDYIANPKANGYRSIHTAVIDEDGKHFEIQIRTKAMHEEAERGVAAHWLYKEYKAGDDTAKISYLRQLIDWHQEVALSGLQEKEAALSALTDNQVYVITPAGDILDLPQGATPLDFAYHLHSELGHRCRGAKINGQIVPLTYTLRTGDKVEITTVLQGNPSRDWLNAEAGYVKTSRARSKISHWFKQQALKEDVAEGKQILEKELARHGISKTISLSTIARSFHLKNEENLLASLGRGNVRIGQVLQALQPKPAEKITPTLISITSEKAAAQGGSAIAGGSDLLTRFAKCCKPIPGDPIVGYITQGRGISIHKKNCNNLGKLSHSVRLMPIDWDQKKTGLFNTDLNIIAQDKQSILNDLTAFFANEKIGLLSFNSTINKNRNLIYIQLTIQIENKDHLQGLVQRIQQLPGVLEVNRFKG